MPDLESDYSYAETDRFCVSNGFNDSIHTSPQDVVQAGRITPWLQFNTIAGLQPCLHFLHSSNAWDEHRQSFRECSMLFS